MVFDFVDNASQYNMPQSLHRLFKLKEYRPGQLAVAPGAQKTAEAALYAKGEKPEALAACPVAAPAAPVLEPKNDRLRLLTVRAGTTMVLAVNEGTAPCTGTLTLPGLAGPCYWYDPWANRCEPADAADTPGGLQVAVRILPLQPRVLVLGAPPAGGSGLTGTVTLTRV